MQRTALFVFLSCGLAVMACGDDTQTSSSSNSSNNTAAGTGGASTSNTGGSTASQGGAGGMIDQCAPNAMDNACVACTRMNCCMEVEACVVDDPCTCLYTCFLAGTDPVDCLTMCPSSPAVSALTQCATSQCVAECV